MRLLTSGSTSPTTAATGRSASAHIACTTTDDLALEALHIEIALAGDDQLGLRDVVVQVEFVGHELEPRLLLVGTLGDLINLHVAFTVGAALTHVAFALLTRRSRNWRAAVDGPAPSAIDPTAVQELTLAAGD